MYVSDKAYGWTTDDGKVCLSLFPASRQNRPFNTYASRDEAQAEIYKRRHRVTGQLAYPEVVWEN